MLPSLHLPPFKRKSAHCSRFWNFLPPLRQNWCSGIRQRPRGKVCSQNRVWALTHSDAIHSHPCEVFQWSNEMNDAWIVQMTLLEKERYRWSNEVDVSQFVIGCFTRVEMRALGLIAIAKRVCSLVMMSSRSSILGHDLQALL